MRNHMINNPHHHRLPAHWRENSRVSIAYETERSIRALERAFKSDTPRARLKTSTRVQDRTHSLGTPLPCTTSKQQHGCRCSLSYANAGHSNVTRSYIFPNPASFAMPSAITRSINDRPFQHAKNIRDLGISHSSSVGRYTEVPRFAILLLSFYNLTHC